MDFTTDKGEHESACASADGEYNEVDYLGMCEELDRDAKETTRVVVMAVDRHLRCYSKTSCQDRDRAGLLRQFSMLPTEELNMDPKSWKFWLCAGEELPDDEFKEFKGLCFFDAETKETSFQHLSRIGANNEGDELSLIRRWISMKIASFWLLESPVQLSLVLLFASSAHSAVAAEPNERPLLVMTDLTMRTGTNTF